MIGRIRGYLVHKQAPVILVEVGGVGYELHVPMTTLFQLPELGVGSLAGDAFRGA